MPSHIRDERIVELRAMGWTPEQMGDAVQMTKAEVFVALGCRGKDPEAYEDWSRGWRRLRLACGGFSSSVAGSPISSSVAVASPRC
jgi:hypothetical protein